jgi:hypothetical protein
MIAGSAEAIPGRVVGKPEVDASGAREFSLTRYSRFVEP